MKIILIRHGKPAIENARWVSPKQFGAWVDAYNLSDVCPSSNPSPELLALVESCKRVVCSDLTRSVNSAARLLPSLNAVQSAIFREFEMPTGTLAFPSLPVSVWLVFYRALWLLNISGNAETKTQAMQRAVTGAEQLIEMANSNREDIAMVGHGLINRAIGKHLSRQGWRKTQSSGNGYWSFSVFETP